MENTSEINRYTANTRGSLPKLAQDKKNSKQSKKSVYIAHSELDRKRKYKH